ncbi:methyl-accepting chemotaxis protein [Acidovorax lacteus]|uniref:Methyl-accepting chemotaxis protein n=1 Tax=Acidovorax lacteus TaxID=1924988 RepID=A0ABP8LB67_9BURK
MNRLTIAGQLRLMAAVSTLILIATSAYFLWEEYHLNRSSREMAVRQNVEIAHSILDWAQQLEKAGTHTREQAQQLGLSALQAARYSGNEYFWLQTVDAKVVMHPFRPDLNGKDGSAIKDPDGKAIFRLFGDRARQPDGGGIVEYQWPKPGQQDPAPKISYVKRFAAWDWVVGSGVYVDDLRATFVASLTRSLVVIGIALAINLLMVRGVYRTVSRGLGKAIRVAHAISQRDLTQEITVKGQDEISELLRAMQRMQTDLIDTLRTVRDTTDQLAQASEQIASGNMDLSSRTESTASSLEQTAASMEQLTGSVAQNAQAARRAASTATSASEVAMQGGQAVSQVVDTMNGISASSRRIADIIGVIDGIAFQTNILALNAAVEAARAGEQGRGFAVVAGEVRSLAQRSAEAAREIKQLIQRSVEQVEAGATQVDAAGQTMDRLVASVQEVHSLIQEITTATGEQSNGIAQVNVAVSELDRMTQQNASLVEESAAAAENLREQAVALAESVNRFRMA